MVRFLVVMPRAPIRVVWSDHAIVKARSLGIARFDIEGSVVGRHASRERNRGAGNWRIVVGRIVVIYNHPDGDDELTARVVTVWRRR